MIRMQSVTMIALLALAPTSLAVADDWQPRSIYEFTSDDTKASVPRIQEHLEFVVDYLREQDTAHLSLSQRRNRARCIARLEEYGLEATFPRNNIVGHLQPIFIDDSGRACAVADLMLNTNACDLAESIVETENLAYVPDMTSPGIARWMESNGLSLDECAMIQPGYGDCEYALENFQCASVGDDVLLTWDEVNGPVDGYAIYRDGVFLEFILNDLGDILTEYTDVDVPPGSYTYVVEAYLVSPCWAEGCTFDHNTWEFTRGDSDNDGTFNGLIDCVYILNWAFLAGPELPCLEAGDANGNGVVEALLDALHILYHQFYDGPAPLMPFPDCGPDPDYATSLGCESPSPVCIP